MNRQITREVPNTGRDGRRRRKVRKLWLLNGKELPDPIHTCPAKIMDTAKTMPDEKLIKRLNSILGTYFINFRLGGKEVRNIRRFGIGGWEKPVPQSA